MVWHDLDGEDDRGTSGESGSIYSIFGDGCPGDIWTHFIGFYELWLRDFIFLFLRIFLYVISIPSAPSGAVIIKSSKRQKGRLPMCNGYPQRHPQEQRGWLQLPARVCRISQIIFWIRKLYFWLSERRPYWQQPADRKQRLCPQAILQWQWAEKKSQGRWWLICGEVQGKIHLHSRYKVKNLDKGHLLS